MNFDLQLPIGNMPELHNQAPALFQDFLDIHQDLLNIAEAISNATVGVDAGGEDISPNDWENWPMNFLHKMIVTYGEDINEGEILYMHANGKVYKWIQGVDVSWPSSFGILVNRGGSDAFATAISSGVADDIKEVMLYGAKRIPNLYITPYNPSYPSYVETATRIGGRQTVPTTPFIVEAGEISVYRIVTAVNYNNRGGSGQGTGWYLGNDYVMVTGGKWYGNDPNN